MEYREIKQILQSCADLKGFDEGVIALLFWRGSEKTIRADLDEAIGTVSRAPGVDAAVVFTNQRRGCGWAGTFARGVRGWAAGARIGQSDSGARTVLHGAGEIPRCFPGQAIAPHPLGRK